MTNARIPMVLAAVLAASTVAAEPAPPDPDMAHAVAQLRDAVGQWAVVTEFLKEDGSVGRQTDGTYSFQWVVPDRVVIGTSEIPDAGIKAGILFYVNEKKRLIEMVSVAADGYLWVMSGPLGGETRHTQVYKGADGREGQLRFTRYNVEPDRFESRMEYTEDGGKTWKPGNHQVFTRRK